MPESRLPRSDAARSPSNTCARFVCSGVPQTIAMRLTGHKTDSVFGRDDIVNPNDLRVAAERLARRG